MTSFITDFMYMSAKDSLLLMVTPSNFLLLLFCIFSPSIEIFLSSIVVIRRGHLSAFAFIAFSSNHWKLSLVLTWKLFNNQIHIFETNIRCCVISITCYVNWCGNKKEIAHVNVKKEWSYYWNLGCSKKYFLPCTIFVINLYALFPPY